MRYVDIQGLMLMLRVGLMAMAGCLVLGGCVLALVLSYPQTILHVMGAVLTLLGVLSIILTGLLLLPRTARSERT